jgi:hypothetical protein
MLERDGVLLTWSLEALPGAWSADGISPTQEEHSPLAAKRLADHRIEYLDYEGPIRGDRGAVSRVDRGEYEVREETDGEIRVCLRGERGETVLALRL